MFEDVQDLYHQGITALARAPKHGRKLEIFDASAKGDNPMCGDRVTIYLRHDGDRIAEIGFEARGCAISIASAELMAETASGHTAPEIAELADAVTEMTRTGATANPALAAMRPLSAVHQFPSRRKCATLPWVALRAALAGSPGVATSE